MKMFFAVTVLTCTTFSMACGTFLPSAADASFDPDAATQEDSDFRSWVPNGSSPNDGGSEGSPNGSDADADTAPPYVYVPSPGAPTFVDDFERADNVDVGNGWTETSGGGFSIVSGDVQLFSFGSSYRPVTYRPSTVTDVELSAAFTLAGTIDETALYARMQPEEATKMGAYAAWVAPSKIEIDLYYKTVSGSGRMTLAQAPILPTLLTNKAYRIYLRVTGTNTVKVEAAVFDGAAPIVSAVGSDSSANRIVDPGSVGFGVDDVQQTKWQEFELRNLN
jgi:hypothetical protein